MHRFTLAGSLLLTVHAGAAGTLPVPLDQPPYDVAFGGTGLVVEPVHGLPAGWADLAADGDRLLSVGAALRPDGTLTGVMARWEADGSRSAGFGNAGLSEVRFGFAEARASAVSFLPKDRKVLVVGHAYAVSPARIGLARFDAATGAPDPAYGHQGRCQVQVELAGRPVDVLSVDDLAVEPGGGRSFLCFHGLNQRAEPCSGLLCRKADGAPDPSFSGNSQILCENRHGADAFHRVAVDSRRRVVTAGRFRHADLSAVMVCRFSADGSPDAAFGFGGTALVPDLPLSRPAGVMVDPYDRVVVAGDTQDPSTLRREYFALRLDGHGDLDPTFGVGGVVRGRFVGLGPTAGLAASAAALDRTGNVVLAGESDSQRDPGWVGLARITPDGRLDTSFSANGSARFTLFHPRYWVGPKSVALDASGRIAVAGTVQDDEQANNAAFLLRATGF